MKILCIEDDQSLAKLLQRTLVKRHYQVEVATDGQMGWDLAETEIYDLILLDWMLPKLTGIEFCKRLRTEKHSTLSPNRNTAILLMTALDTVTNKVIGLDAGADDYVVKPFDLDELMARIRALLRRSQGTRSPLLQWGKLCLNPNNCEVTYQEQPIFLTAKEYELLEIFLRHPAQIFSIDRLLMALWTAEEMPSEGAVRAHIKGLRQKLKRAGADDPLETVYRLGYRLRLTKESKANEDVPTSEEPTKDRQTPEPLDFSSPSSTSSSLIPPELWDVWRECRQSYRDRLSIIEQAVIALQNKTLSLKQQHEAEREAHTLTGSLGSFGLDEASQISRKIQKILKQQEPIGNLEITQLNQLITALGIYLQEEKEQEKPKEINKILKSPSTTSLETSLLIVDDDLPLAQLLQHEAVSWGFRAEIATDLETAQQSLNSDSINAILLDLNLCGSANGLEFLATAHHQYPDIPVLILTAEETFEKRVEAARLGSRCFLQKPILPAQVLAAVTQVLQQMNHSAARILIVDDDPALLSLLNTLLEPCGYQLTLLSEPQQFWQKLEQTTPDLLILDIELCEPATSQSSTGKTTIPPLSGIELCQVIRSDPRWNRLPVLFLSAQTDVETVQRTFAAGANDFLSKPVVPQELLTRVKTRLEQRNLWGVTELDELTGLSLRRKAQQDLAQSIRLAQTQQQPFCLALLDLDNFKQVNDRYGHHTGDYVLNYFGKLLRQSLRQEDIVGRWGGEEFIIGMYGITKQDGLKRLQEVLDQLNLYVFLADNQESFLVTFSAGIAQLPNDGADLKTLCYCADQALYQAKSAGRNQIFAPGLFEK
ncbi:MAG TPA: response regulator [Leptolyngbyaceae cyanobacterium]